MEVLIKGGWKGSLVSRNAFLANQTSAQDTRGLNGEATAFLGIKIRLRGGFRKSLQMANRTFLIKFRGLEEWINSEGRLERKFLRRSKIKS